MPKGRNSAHISNNFGEFKRNHQIPVFGLYPNYTNKVKVELLDYFGNPVLSQSIEIKTEPVIRAQSGEMAVLQNSLNDEQRNRLFLIQNTIYDGAGDIRWYTTHGGQKFYSLTGGLIGIQPFPDKGWIKEGPDIEIINYLGEITDTFDVPHRMHHEINEKTPGGNLLVATNAEEYFTTDDDTEDMIIEIDRSTGEVIKEWDLRNIFDPERPRIWTENVNDWCHLNSIEYDPRDNSLLISSKLQYFISKIDYDTGEILWICGNHENWKEPWQDYLLNPLNFDTTEHVDHDWTYAQHMPRITGEGTFIVYDNGVERPGTDYTRAVEFSVNKENMTVEKIWTHNMDNAARTMGSVYVYNDNTIQIGHAKDGEILIVTRENNILFHGKLLTYYRAYPIRLY
ncbi:MAG: aryl-sulfate sulfotransferase [Bacteroidales bacterium]